MNKQKYYFVFFIVFLFCNHTLHAQYNINLLLGRPPQYLSDWSKPISGQLIINYTGVAGNPQPVKIFTQLQDVSGSTIATSNTANAQLINTIRGAVFVTMDRVLQLENMQFSGSLNTLTTSGKLPPGNYQICVQLLDANGVELTSVQCRPFVQIQYQLPFLLTPNDKQWLDANTAQTAIIFRWSNVTPASQELNTYRLQVYEVLTDQTPMQALRSNQPILLIEQQKSTQYIWRPQLSLKDSANHVFIWTVQTLDREGQPIGIADVNTQGNSEPRVFGICNKKLGINTANCGEGYIWNFN